MSPAARRELIGIGALVAGLFLALTLLPLPVTGRLGHSVGEFLRKTFGIGAALLPVLGIGWALAAFERLGTLSTARTASLVAALMLLIPYGVGIISGADAATLPANYAAWDAGQRVVGILPAFFATLMRSTVGTAGGVLVGLFVLSAAGLLTIGWHPLIVLRQRPAVPEPAPSPTRSKREQLPLGVEGDAPDPPEIGRAHV